MVDLRILQQHNGFAIFYLTGADHLQRFAYNGVGAVVGVGDLVSRSDMKGGRTPWGDVPLKVRDEVVPGAQRRAHSHCHRSRKRG